jgi:hypothetical protein
MLLRPIKTDVFSRRQTCGGKSQEARSLDGRMEGNEPKVLKPIDKVSLGRLRVTVTVESTDAWRHCRLDRSRLKTA